MKPCDPVYMGNIVFDIISNNWHQPLQDGHVNRDNIEEAITVGILTKKLQPLSQLDVDLIVKLVDTMIKDGFTGEKI